MKYAKQYTFKVQGEEVHGRDMSAKVMRDFEKAEQDIDKILIIFAGCATDGDGKRIFASTQEVEDADVAIDFMSEFVSALLEKSKSKKKL